MTEKTISKKQRRTLKKLQKEQEEAKKLRASSITRFIGWGIGIAALIGLGGFLKIAFTPPPPGSIPELKNLSEGDHVKGASQSAALLVEYSDFQCPACRTYHPIVEQVLDEKGSEVSFVYRHFPLSQHANADEAARAAEAAAEQDKFWEMHALLFDRQDDWAEKQDVRDLFISYAEQLSLDRERFISSMDSDKVKEKVSNDYNSGVRFGVNATPTFFLNGIKIQPGSLDEFLQLINEANSTN